MSEGACEVREKEASDRGGSARENETKEVKILIYTSDVYMNIKTTSENNK